MSTPDLTKQYQKKTDKQHILDAPDTYIGSIEKNNMDVYVLKDGEKKEIVQKEINVIPGLYKLYDEGIVNCRDHVIRMKKDEKNNQVSYISITINDEGVITMTNDGNGIDVAEHPEYKVWIPELIFGHLRTSTNYNKEEKKIIGGKNGFGFKLVLIWSTWGSIETVDHNRKLKYVQEFSDNLDRIGKPKITKCSNKPYTKVSFKPDYKRLGIDSLTPDMLDLFKRRVYDIAAVTDKTVKVKFNNEIVPVKTFQNYVDLYLGESSKIYEQGNERWEYAVSLTKTDEFSQVSFVNGIYTSKGGKHVEYILNQITKGLVAYIKKKKKIDVKPNTIKEQLILFVRCDIENPVFDSQTKDYMSTPISKFGSSCTISEKFIEKIAKLGVMDSACALTGVKDAKALTKTDGKQVKSIRGIPKLIDANYAGTSKSKDCTIIFCEGDSAKAGIVSGLSKEDRNFIGVYPMRGKMMNVRDETDKKIGDNKEITEIKQILGLQSGKKYKKEDIEKSLRYGKILFMTDQDLDGSHIKGLGINMFHSLFESLVKITGFIGFMNTPILKATKGKECKIFYNDGEYELWKNDNDTKGWTIKYYKGLGTSTSKEFKEYFEKKKTVEFEYNDLDSDNAIDKVFNKKRSDDRKDWLSDYNRELYLDTNKNSVSYEEFINREMIHYSKYDCDRSIANVMDGLKLSLRKILFGCFKKNLTKEIKVAQLSGYISEHSGYHHGEASLNSAIVGMAQNFVGSNNLNLLLPNGQFGTRLQGGKDSASERYIFTQLNNLTRIIYNINDDAVLKYLQDDGQQVEPLYYGPILPMILVNGTNGIGTGFSSFVMNYNINDIVYVLKNKLKHIPYTDDFKHETLDSYEIKPYYNGFTGTIDKVSESKFIIKGKYEKIKDNKIQVTELPVGYWTEDFKMYLETLLSDKKSPIKDYKDQSTDKTVDFTITFIEKETIENLEKENYDNLAYNGIEKLLKLYRYNNTNNMHLFDQNDKLKKYNDVMEIMADYYFKRFDMYKLRKQDMEVKLREELKLVSNRARYIQENLDDTIDLRKKSNKEVVDLLISKKYEIIDNDDKFKYLLKMPMDSVTKEHVDKLLKEKTDLDSKLNKLLSTKIEEMWLQDIEMFEKEYSKLTVQKTKVPKKSKLVI